MMPLTLADIGEKNIIKHIGGSPEVKKHLENLGFVVGGEATLITSMEKNAAAAGVPKRAENPALIPHIVISL